VPQWIAWCSHCRAQVEGEPGFLPPFYCELCGEALEMLAPVDLAARLVAEHTRPLFKARASPPPRENTKRRLISMRDAAAALGVRRAYLLEQIRAGHVQAIGIGHRTRIPRSEMDRILASGLPELPGEAKHVGPTPSDHGATLKRRRSPTPKGNGSGTPDQIAADIMKARL